jgi:hypothetical protein
MMKFTSRMCMAVCVVFFANAVSGPAAIYATRLKTAQGKPKAKAGAVAKATPFKPSCATPSFPTPPPTNKLEIDAECGLAGSGSGVEGQQDMVKNNFCGKGRPRLITVADLIRLQAQVEKNKRINFGDENSGARMKGPTTNRAPLKKLGEGSVVTLTAFVLIARQEGPESVNCKKALPADSTESLLHDVHISLVASKDASPDDECSGVVAEMSPHHRPDDWTHENVERAARAKLPVRVTGQLYFDSSHFPCSKGQGVRSNPKRVSLWEIHPIYKFEVCTANCDAAGNWLALDEWAKQRK